MQPCMRESREGGDMPGKRIVASAIELHLPQCCNSAGQGPLPLVVRQEGVSHDAHPQRLAACVARGRPRFHQVCSPHYNGDAQDTRDRPRAALAICLFRCGPLRDQM